MSDNLSGGNHGSDKDESDLRTVLESNIETLRRTVDEMESAIDKSHNRSDGDSSRGADQEDRPGSIESSSIDMEMSALLKTKPITRLVVTNFDTTLSLLEQDLTASNQGVKIILTNDLSERLSDRFPINSYFQKLQDNDGIEIRQGIPSETSPAEIVVSDDTIYYPVTFGSVQTYLRNSDDRFYQKMVDAFDLVFTEAEALDLSIPPWKELLEGLSEATSQETAREFDALVEALTPENIDSLDEVSLALIAAARTGALQYNIAKWGEEMNLASKATFSRRKSALVDDGVITTESVQVEIGRPRDRLLLADNQPDHEKDSARSQPGSKRGDTTPPSKSENQNTTQSRSSDALDETAGTSAAAGDPDDELDKIIRDVLLAEDP